MQVPSVGDAVEQQILETVFRFQAIQVQGLRVLKVTGCLQFSDPVLQPVKGLYPKPQRERERER